MREEQRAAEALGLPWSTRLFVPGHESDRLLVGAGVGAGRQLGFKRAFYRWLAEEATRYDVLLLRYTMYDPLQWRFISRSRIPVFTVHHTLEVPQLRGGRGLRRRLHASAESVLGPLSIRAAAGVVGVTGEIARYETRRAGGGEIRTLVYPNGISFGDPLPDDERTDDCPHLLFVATHFYDWHGLDLLFRSALSSTLDFRVHLVGALSDEQRAAAARDPRFVVHGVLRFQEVEALASRCWVGLSSFALDRKGMEEACTLKVREYLRSGLPVYAGYRDVFHGAMPFYRNGVCSIESILEFARSVRPYSREAVSRAARPFIDKETLVRELYEHLCTEIGSDRGLTALTPGRR
jgi:glycosyltransferase involved in cell wall biosynthesis